jgi:hypothetical protein
MIKALTMLNVSDLKKLLMAICLNFILKCEDGEVVGGFKANPLP